MSEDYVDVRYVIGKPCIFTFPGYLDPRCILRAHEDAAPVMTMWKSWFWQREASIAWRNFTGRFLYQTPTPLPFLKWPLIRQCWELLFLPQTRLAIVGTKVLGVARLNPSRSLKGLELITDLGRYAMFLWNGEIRVTDDETELISCDCCDHGLVVHCWRPDIELLVAFIFWWRFHNGGGD